MAVSEKEKQETRYEQPLSGFARTLLLVSCAAISIVNYLFAAFAIVLSVVVLVLDIIIGIIALRIGLAQHMVRPVQAVYYLIVLLIGSLRLEEGLDCHVSIPESVAPELYELTNNMAKRIGVEPPNELVFEMQNNASVQLHGYKTGQGKVKLTIGFDLMAILNREQFESILAHELAHAKLVQRGFRIILLRGAQRCIQMARDLSLMCESARSEKRRFFTAEFLRLIINQLSKTAVKTVSTYIRQDEFAADRIAAQMCGGGVCKSAMRVTIAASVKGSDLSLDERLMHLERDESFTDWLRNRLTPESEEERAELEKISIEDYKKSEYDSHPAPADRLAMWGDEEYIPSHTEPAISLVKEPDYIARKLTDEIERVITKLEQDDTDKLSKWIQKKQSSNIKLTTAQICILLVAIVCALLSVVAWFNGAYKAALMTWFLLVLCVGPFYKYGFKDPLPLPFPEYRLLKKKLKKKVSADDAVDAELEKRLIEKAESAGSSKDVLAAYWIDCVYGALKNCDFKTALIASRLCLKSGMTCDEVLIGNGIAEAFFGNSVEANKSIDQIFSNRNLMGTLTWGFGWSFVLQESYDVAEVYLLDAAKRYPNEPTVFALLSRCQWMREKQNEALKNIRRAVELQPDSFAFRLSLVRILLELKKMKAAQQYIEELKSEKPYDEELMLCEHKYAAILGKMREAEDIASELMEKHPEYKNLEMIAEDYIRTGEYDRAALKFRRLLEHGHSPLAWFGLYCAEMEKKNKEAARIYLLRALDLCKQPLPKLVPVEKLIGSILMRLVDPDKEAVKCGAWYVRIEMESCSADIQRLSLFIAAPTQKDAQEYINWLYSEMLPGSVLDESKVSWEQAPEDEQPEEPITPGIYGYCINEER